jgi:hypothetical protein
MAELQGIQEREKLLFLRIRQFVEAVLHVIRLALVPCDRILKG